MCFLCKLISIAFKTQGHMSRNASQLHLTITIISAASIFAPEGIAYETTVFMAFHNYSHYSLMVLML